MGEKLHVIFVANPSDAEMPLRMLEKRVLQLNQWLIAGRWQVDTTAKCPNFIRAELPRIVYGVRLVYFNKF
jgi:hypothetical protein